MALGDLVTLTPPKQSRGADMVGTTVEPYVRGRVRQGEITALTARNHRTILYQFATSAGCASSDLKERHVRRWLEDFEHLAQSTRRNRLAIVKSFCRWLHEAGRSPVDAALRVRSMKEPTRVPRALTAQQVALILDACVDTRARLAVLLMVQEGLRRGEVARLQVGDVNLQHGVMTVTGKGGHQRVLHVTEQARLAVIEHLSVEGAVAGPLLRSRQFPQRGLHPDTVSALVRRAMEAAGVKRAPFDGVNPHALRHTALTHMLIAGAHVRDVQQVAGHRNLSTTERYLPLLVGTLSGAMSGRWY